MTRTLTLLMLLAAPVLAQDQDRLVAARSSVVGVQARRSIEVRGHPLLMAQQQVGVVIARSEDAGYILTPSLGQDPQDIQVFLPGASEPLEAEFLDSDENYTVLRVEGELPAPAEFAQDWQPAEGQKVVWIGLLTGALGRWTPVAKEARVDALIPESPGQPGAVYSDPPFTGGVSAVGALVLDSSGRAVGVVGVLRAAEDRSGRPGMRGPAGLPVVQPCATFAHFLAGPDAERGFLGISVEGLTDKVAEALGMSGTRGVIVTQVTPGSAAASAGILAQDVVTRVAGEAVEDAAALMRALRGHAPGAKVAVDLVRLTPDGPQAQSIEAVLGERETAANAERLRAPRFGFVATELTPAIRRMESLDADVAGAYVRRVTPGSPAALGRPQPLQGGDIILKVNSRPVPDLATLREALDAAEDGKAASFFVRSGTETRFVDVTPEPAAER